MSTIPYHDRHFRAVGNSATGEVDDRTVFHYRQEGDVIWATYHGGQVRFGTLVARQRADGTLDMRYHHINLAGDMMTGECRSQPELLADGRLRLHENWQWTCGDRSRGESVVDEFRP